ncbi:MAG: hypothetical protein WCC37_11565 [Candidatus Sulfotelmatobacter sp.]|jgi:hypothetical protein
MSQSGILPSNLGWKQLYQNAMVELDAAQLPRRITDARTAMLDRAKEIFDRTVDEEFHALCKGLGELRLLEEAATRQKPAA